MENPLTVAMLKTGAGLCKSCFYLKRGSLDNMKVSELVQHLTTNQNFKEKYLDICCKDSDLEQD